MWSRYLIECMTVLMLAEMHEGKPVPGFEREDPQNSDRMKSDIPSEVSDKMYDHVSGGDMLIFRWRTQPAADARERRAVNVLPAFKWSGGIVPYVVAPSAVVYSEAIGQAIDHLHLHTCVRFIPRTNEAAYVQFEDGIGCRSYIGKYPNADMMQAIELEASCGKHWYVVLHEMLHALGFLHEHTRIDRDDYVRLNESNISPDALPNFLRYDDPASGIPPSWTISLQGLPYDKSSIMHYYNTAFAKDPRYYTIYSKSKVDEFLGSVTGFSELDKLRVNLFYTCVQTTSAAPLTPPLPPSTTASTTSTQKAATTTTTTTSAATAVASKTTTQSSSSVLPFSSSSEASTESLTSVSSLPTTSTSGLSSGSSEPSNTAIFSRSSNSKAMVRNLDRFLLVHSICVAFLLRVLL